MKIASLLAASIFLGSFTSIAQPKPFQGVGVKKVVRENAEYAIESISKGHGATKVVRLAYDNGKERRIIREMILQQEGAGIYGLVQFQKDSVFHFVRAANLAEYDARSGSYRASLMQGGYAYNRAGEPISDEAFAFGVLLGFERIDYAKHPILTLKPSLEDCVTCYGRSPYEAQTNCSMAASIGCPEPLITNDTTRIHCESNKCEGLMTYTCNR